MNAPLTTDPQFAVVIRMQIQGAFATLSSSDVWLERRFAIPFAPTVGIRFRDGDWSSEPIEEIYWERDKNRFMCYVKTEDEIYEGIRHRRPHRPMREIVAAYLKEGWQEEREDD